MAFQLGLYEKLAERGALRWLMGLASTASGRPYGFRGSPVGFEPEFILCDRFRLNDLLDWNESSIGFR